MISIIIPTYNSEEYICEAINSVLCQTFNDFEIIVVDDGSKDKTKQTIKNNFPKIKYFYIENQGAARARNFGIKKAKGEFVAFLDADDLWLPKKLEKQINAFQDDPNLMMVFTDNLNFDSNSIIKTSFNKKEKLMSGDIVKNIFKYSNVTTPSVMVRRSVFDEVGLFEENLKAAEDDNLWMRIALRFRVDLIDEVLVHCRITEGSLSRTPWNILDGVKKNLELIESKYPELAERLGYINIRKRKSDVYFNHGYYLFSTKQFLLARAHFLKAFFYFPRISIPIYFLCSFLPESIIERIKLKKKSHRPPAKPEA